MLKRLSAYVAILGLSLLATHSAEAARPKLLRVHQQIEIAAAPDKVWGIIENFSDLTWHPAIKKSDATNGNTPGSIRTLDLGGPRLAEQLVSYDGAKMTYTYKFTDDPANLKTIPASDYQSTITVKKAAKGGSKVTWSGTFRRPDPSPTPAAGMDDEAATKAVTGVYTSGLAALKQKAEN